MLRKIPKQSLFCPHDKFAGFHFSSMYGTVKYIILLILYLLLVLTLFFVIPLELGFTNFVV